MRLLTRAQNGEFSLTKDLIDNIPPYAILSHTWSLDEDEVTLEDVENSQTRAKPSGFAKLQFCMDQAARDDLHYVWIDTCCIHKANHAELSEAITSMFNWYRGSVKCYVYLSDVSAKRINREEHHTQRTWELDFRRSRWFRRGWTLQELLAPKTVEFFSHEGEFLGNKNTLGRQLLEITGIPISALQGEPLSNFTVDQRMEWVMGRETKKKEDRAYCLLGIFNVSMSLRYGEGDKAFIRLENKVKKSSKHHDLIAWLAPFRSEEFQSRVAAARHPGFGSSFNQESLSPWLRSVANRNSLMWITGKSGSGKTALFSSAVDFIKDFASESPTVLVAYHYHSFSDPDSQQLVNFLGSLAVQVSLQHPGILEDLKGDYEKEKSRNQGKTLQPWKLEHLLTKYIRLFDTAFILADALDESGNFWETISCISNLLERLPNLKVMVTSTRRATSVGSQFQRKIINVQIQPDEDIKSFVEAQLSNQPTLQHLSIEAKDRVKTELLSNADQSFRWVFLTLENLCRQRTGRAVMNALSQLPQDLNRTYASMLDRIPAMDMKIAREALLWLSFALRPLTLIEVSEAVVLENSDTTLDPDSRLHDPEVILEICHGFLEYNADSGIVKLAHASVRNYLVTEYAGRDGNSLFSSDGEQANRWIMQKCLTYLMFDEFSSREASHPYRMAYYEKNFPLLDYAAHYWGLHASSATTYGWALAEKFFSTHNLPHGGNYSTWMDYLYFNAMKGLDQFHYIPRGLPETHPLYFAASFGMAPIVKILVSQDLSVDLERPGGRYGSTALQVACYRARREVAEILVAAGADFWSADEGSGEPAWYWAQVNGWTDLVDQMRQLKPDSVGIRKLSEEDLKWGRLCQRDDWHSQSQNMYFQDTFEVSREQFLLPK